MKAVILCMLMLSFAAQAAQDSAETVSAGKFRADDSLDLNELLKQRGRLNVDAPATPRYLFGATEGMPDVAARAYAAHGAAVQFDIFDAWVELSGDSDRDGYFHRINVVFDADVNTALETVYVKLYLSREGGDWIQYSSSDLFEIQYDSSADTYEVVTELVEGYRPGYYDVLVELYAMNHAGLVASRVVQQDDSGAFISLEDSGFDDPYVETVTTIETTTVHGAGSVSAAGLIMYLLLVLVKLRYFRKSPSRRT
jgi:hypothetical protein